MPYEHIPVMVQEVLQYLDCRPGKIYVDGTLGGGGHALAILEKILPGGRLIGFDQDRDAVTHARKSMKPYSHHIQLVHGNFVQLPDILASLNIAAVDGIFLDLGLSLHHLRHSGRGFSFQQEEPLDMRMDTGTKLTATYIVNRWPETELRKILTDYGEERWARQIARAIVSVRSRQPIETSRALAQVVTDAVPGRGSGPRRIHPATRVFMALRIAVNRELERLESFMDTAADQLNSGGRLCVLSYHSLEDRIVKHRIRWLEKGCSCPPHFPACVCDKRATVQNLTRKVVKPTPVEIEKNPMARSARLRAMEKR